MLHAVESNTINLYFVYSLISKPKNQWLPELCYVLTGIKRYFVYFEKIERGSKDSKI